MIPCLCLLQGQKAMAYLEQLNDDLAKVGQGTEG